MSNGPKCNKESSGLKCQRAKGYSGFHRAHTPGHTAYWRTMSEHPSELDQKRAEKWLAKVPGRSVSA